MCQLFYILLSFYGNYYVLSSFVPYKVNPQCYFHNNRIQKCSAILQYKLYYYSQSKIVTSKSLALSLHQ